MPTLRLDQDECWVIHEWVRQDRSAPNFGQEHDLAFVQRLWRAILDLNHPEKKGQSTQVKFKRGELLQITRQVSAMIMVGSCPIGKEILKKSFAALLDDMEVDDVQVPDVFRNAYQDDAGNQPNGGADAEALSG